MLIGMLRIIQNLVATEYEGSFAPVLLTVYMTLLEARL